MTAINTELVPCIYCGTLVDPRIGEGDHVIPAVFGRFVGELHFRRICRACNSAIGRCEEQITKCGPESYLRRKAGAASARRNRGEGWVGAHGSPPPRSTVANETHGELIDTPLDGSADVKPIDQLVIIDEQRHECHVRLHPQMTAKQLGAKVKRFKPVGRIEVRLHASEPLWPRYVDLLKQLWPRDPIVEVEGREIGNHRVRVSIKFIVSRDYWRAIAKIGFHYYLLTTSRRFQGDEPQFAALRRFIIEGGDRVPFFSAPSTRLVTPFRSLPQGGVLTPDEWCHILAAEDTEGTATAMVSLFMGPGHVAPVYHVTLGSIGSRLIVPSSHTVHTYLYEPGEIGYAGRVVEEGLTRVA